jgi:hypothetical protein
MCVLINCAWKKAKTLVGKLLKGGWSVDIINCNILMSNFTKPDVTSRAGKSRMSLLLECSVLHERFCDCGFWVVCRFYVDTIGLLRDIQTVELFYFNARQAVFKVTAVFCHWGSCWSCLNVHFVDSILRGQTDCLSSSHFLLLYFVMLAGYLNIVHPDWFVDTVQSLLLIVYHDIVDFVLSGMWV